MNKLINLIASLVAFALCGCSPQITTMHFGPSPGDPKTVIKVEQSGEKGRRFNRVYYKKEMHIGIKRNGVERSGIAEEMYA